MSELLVIKKEGVFDPCTVDGRVQILQDPLVKAPLSKEDQIFFKEQPVTDLVGLFA